MSLDELKDHLRQEHGIHEAPEEVVETGAEASFGPGVSTEQLEELHHQHHRANPELLRHSHADEPTTG
jgi:hypothetical protein